MALDINYAKRLENFIKAVADMQNEVEAGTILDEKNRLLYETKLKMPITTAYLTTLKLYQLAINGKKDDFVPYFADISAILAGFEKQPFRELIEKSGTKIKSLEELAKQTEQTKPAENKTSENPVKIIRNGIFFDNGSNNSKEYQNQKDQNQGKRNEEDTKIKITHDINFFGYIQNDKSKYGGK